MLSKYVTLSQFTSNAIHLILPIKSLPRNPPDGTILDSF